MMIYGQAADKRLQMGREKDMYLRMGRLAAHQYRVTPSLDAAISPRTLQCLLINDRPCEDDISGGLSSVPVRAVMIRLTRVHPAVHTTAFPPSHGCEDP